MFEICVRSWHDAVFSALGSLRHRWLVLVQAVHAAVGSAKVPVRIPHCHCRQPRDLTEQFAPGIGDGA